MCWDGELSAGATAWDGHGRCQGSGRSQLLPGLLSAIPRGPGSPPAPGGVIWGQPSHPVPTFGPSSPPFRQLGGAHPDTWGLALPPRCLCSSHSPGLAHTHPAQSSGSARESAPAGGHGCSLLLSARTWMSFAAPSPLPGLLLPHPTPRGASEHPQGGIYSVAPAWIHFHALSPHQSLLAPGFLVLASAAPPVPHAATHRGWHWIKAAPQPPGEPWGWSQQRPARAEGAAGARPPQDRPGDALGTRGCRGGGVSKGRWDTDWAAVIRGHPEHAVHGLGPHSR